MAKQEKKETSPFAELSFRDQQDKWREWRSRQWNFRDTQEDVRQETKPRPEQNDPLPPPARPAPTRHRELDRVLNRHQTAVKKAGVFLSTTQTGPTDK